MIRQCGNKLPRIYFLAVFVLALLLLATLSTFQQFPSHWPTKTKKILDFDWSTHVKQKHVENAVARLSKSMEIKSKDVLEKLRRNLLNQPQKLTKSLLNMEQRKMDLPVTTAIPPELWINYEEKWNGMSLPIILLRPSGRLGNQMCTYATGYALQRIYNASILLAPSMRKHLQGFQKLSIPVLPDNVNTSKWLHLRRQGIYKYIQIELVAAGLLGPGFFVHKDYPDEMHLYHRFRAELKKEFAFSDDVLSQVQLFLKDIKAKRKSSLNPDPVFVGIHIRRTDFINHMRAWGGFLPGKFYFNQALTYYRKQYPKGGVVFIAASDDRKYVSREIGMHEDVILSPGSSPLYDQALLSSCNHSIITQGTFGFWTAFLAGGKVVYPGASYLRPYKQSKYYFERLGLEDFIPLPVNDTTLSGELHKY